MKHIHLLLAALCGFAVILSSCNKNSSYANEIKNEKKLIADYIKRNHINIIYEEPEYMEWGEKDYLEVSDYCYFHLNVPGDTTSEEIVAGDYVNVRYRRYTLDVNSDTLSFWNTLEMAYPIQFQYGVSSSSACTAWHLALGKMKYTDAEGTIICPSKLGFTDDNSSVIPYCYDLKMQIKRY